MKPTLDGTAAAPDAVDVPAVTGRWWLAVLLTSGMIFCYAQRGTLSVAAPFMIRELGINTETMGLMLSAFSWCYCFMQVPAGWFVDRFGVRRAYTAGFVVWSIACALTGAFRNIAAIMGFRITMGVGQSVAFPASARTVANWFSDTERGLVNSSYLIGVRLGQALVNAAGIGLIALYGWRMFFVLSGLAPLLWIVPWTLVLRRWERPGTSVAVAGGSNRFTFASSFGLLRHRSVLGTFLGFIAFDYVWFVFGVLAPGLSTARTPLHARADGVSLVCAVSGDVGRDRAVGYRSRQADCAAVFMSCECGRRSSRSASRSRWPSSLPGWSRTTARRSGC